MLKDVVEVKPLAEHRLYLRFEDGVEGELNMADLVPFQGVFSLLADQDEFNRVQLNAESGTVEWPNGADLDPDVLYAKITGQAIPDYAPPATRR